MNAMFYQIGRIRVNTVTMRLPKIPRLAKPITQDVVTHITKSLSE